MFGYVLLVLGIILQKRYIPMVLQFGQNMTMILSNIAHWMFYKILFAKNMSLIIGHRKKSACLKVVFVSMGKILLLLVEKQV